MLGLFGTLNLATRSLSTQRTGVEVAGQNLANVNNPAYARQRVLMQTSLPLNSQIGPQGTGADAVAIQQLRDAIVDSQINGEMSIGGFFESQVSALQFAQSSLGEILDRTATSAQGTAAAGGAGSWSGMAADLNNLFAAFQEASTSPNGTVERELIISRAQSLATRFNQTSARLDSLSTSIDRSIETDLVEANKLLVTIADLNDRIADAENSSNAVANDLRDLRESKIEELSKLVKVDINQAANGTVGISVNGNSLVDGKQVLDTLESYDAGGGQRLVRLATAGTPLALTGGKIQGSIDVRDNALGHLRDRIDTLASTLITEVNAVHNTGFALNGSTGTAFFTGTNSADIRVNSVLVGDSTLMQLSGAAGESGNNTVALALGKLKDQSFAALGNHTFTENYSDVVAGLGQALADAKQSADDQDAVQKMLLQQRDSLSGVSIDEEMSDLMKYQKAFQASAQLVSVVDEMLSTLINMKR